MGKTAFGGGCDWCTEAIFQSLRGVHKVEQDRIASNLTQANEFSEAVIVHFNPAKISLDILIEVNVEETQKKV